MESEIEQIIAKHFNVYKLKSHPGGASGAQIYQVNGADGAAYLLKVQKTSTPFGSLQHEKTNYEWLKGKIMVPEVKFYERGANHEFLCIEHKRGKTLDKFIGEIPDEEIVKRYLSTMKLLHTLPVPINARFNAIEIQTKIDAARFNIDKNLVDVDDFQTAHKGVSMEALFSKLLANRPTDQELVFTHGDYCLDNIIYDHNRFNGLIDIGRGGLADRYQDVALALRTITNIFPADYSDLFCKEYGLENLNQKKVDFYMLLDEFF